MQQLANYWELMNSAPTVYMVYPEKRSLFYLFPSPFKEVTKILGLHYFFKGAAKKSKPLTHLHLKCLKLSKMKPWSFYHL